MSCTTVWKCFVTQLKEVVLVFGCIFQFSLDRAGMRCSAAGRGRAVYECASQNHVERMRMHWKAFLLSSLQYTQESQDYLCKHIMTIVVAPRPSPRWCNSYRACCWKKVSRVQTRQRTMQLFLPSFLPMALQLKSGFVLLSLRFLNHIQLDTR
jgi:hypothetical protein